MTSQLVRSMSSRQLLGRILDTPNLVEAVRAMSPQAFTKLVQHVGVEDLGEVIALASTEQIVAAFDEDLFRNERPGERERLDPARLATWLQILLEAGEQAAADRVSELSEDFVAHALLGLLIVLDHDALRARLLEDDDDAALADKAIESALSEEIDGYLLLAREQSGWDAALALILALDRDHRDFLVRVLDLCVSASSSYLDDLDALAGVLDAADALAEEVEGERVDRRAARGYVEARSARHFLSLAQQPTSQSAAAMERDPITHGYFRDLDRSLTVRHTPERGAPSQALLQLTVGLAADGEPPRLARAEHEEAALLDALRELQLQAPKVFDERMEELAYLANVLIAGGESTSARYRPADAARTALLTVAQGAVREADARADLAHRPRVERMAEVLRVCSADRLFRSAWQR